MEQPDLVMEFLTVLGGPLILRNFLGAMVLFGVAVFVGVSDILLQGDRPLKAAQLQALYFGLRCSCGIAPHMEKKALKFLGTSENPWNEE